MRRENRTLGSLLGSAATSDLIRAYDYYESKLEQVVPGYRQGERGSELKLQAFAKIELGMDYGELQEYTPREILEFLEMHQALRLRETKAPRGSGKKSNRIEKIALAPEVIDRLKKRIEKKSDLSARLGINEKTLRLVLRGGQVTRGKALQIADKIQSLPASAEKLSAAGLRRTLLAK